MGRGKIEIKKIENVNSRQVTFSKRRTGLLKKAKELSVLCDADIAVIIYSSTGKLYDFSSCGMDQILSRYTKAPSNVELPTVENVSEIPHSEINALKDEITRLRAQNMRLQGKCLEGLSLKDLQQLEHQLNEGMLSVKAKKDAEQNLLMEQLEKSRKQAVMEKETLRKEVEELREALRSSCEESPTLKRKHSAITSAHDEVCNGVGVENNEHSFDVSLRLGMLPTIEGCDREKTLKLESNSDESTSHMAST